ncbi:MAG TPA: GNAT family N-acetyltransferase [Candidatus Paceibacterota bacterium]
MDIEQARKEHYKEIVSLFEQNYFKYHYDSLVDISKLSQLFKQGFMGWVALDNKRVIGFAGLYKKAVMGIPIIELAHLLVDEKFRGQHLGSILEKTRETYYKNIWGCIVLASCVENPIQSIILKKKHGFVVLGARVNYRPQTENRSNSVLLGKYYGLPKLKYIEEVGLLTSAIITKQCNEIGIKRIIRTGKGQATSKYMLDYNQKLGRAIAYLGDNQLKDELILEDMVNVLKNVKCPYTSIKINALLDGLSETDKILVNNGFYPAVYIPGYGLNADIIEYQYFQEYEINEYNKIINNLKVMNIYENSPNVCSV